MNKFLIVTSMVLGLASGAALAQNNPAYPDSNSGVPGTPNNTDYVDKNGDGCIELDEVKPGSQLAKRFATRDKNKDGKLCKDEYYFQ